MKRSLKILLVLFAFSPLWIASDNVSPWGYLAVTCFFFVVSFFRLETSKKFSLFIIRLYTYFACLFLLVSSFFAVPIIADLISSANFNPENFVYAFKQISFLSIDVNYISLIFLVSFFSKPSCLGFVLILFSASRAAVLISLLLLAARFFFPALIKARTIVILVCCLLLFTITTLEPFVDGFDISSNANQSIISSRSIVYKLLTYRSFVDLVSADNLTALLFGTGITFDQDSLTITGHTLFGVIAKNGLIYIICSTIVLYLSCGNRSLNSKLQFFAVLSVSLFSMTALFFVSPLCFSYSCISSLKRPDYFAIN